MTARPVRTVAWLAVLGCLFIAGDRRDQVLAGDGPTASAGRPEAAARPPQRPASQQRPLAPAADAPAAVEPQDVADRGAIAAYEAGPDEGCVDSESSDAGVEPPLEEEVEAGHSYHGEVFNEGPRQRAYLMHDTGRVNFPVTGSEQAQQFVSQGLGQFYGFWYLEAERSFRQAAALDPDCAMAYWGAALSNYRNTKRARGFLEEAVKRKDKVTARERMYIEALSKLMSGDSKKKKENSEQYARALEKLLYEYPDDVEAEALLALQLYINRSAGSKIVSYFAVNALLGEVFAVQPLHPAHHFRIHLWDSERPANALQSAALCGQASPRIAHMWHMPGHIYSRLKRYHEAAWQQEASARVDHAHMMRDRVMPDRIHNFAHNNEWLIRNLMFVGRVHDALDLAKNMLELPRHPKYNTLSKSGGSASYGRQRLLQVLRRYELWDQALALADTPYLEPGETLKRQLERLALQGEAEYRRGQREAGKRHLDDVARQLAAKQAKRDQAGDQARRKNLRQKAPARALDDDAGRPLPPWEQAPAALTAAQKKALAKAVADARRPMDGDVRELEKAQRLIDGWRLWSLQSYKEALAQLRKAGGVDPLDLARVQFLSGERNQAIDAVKRHVASHKGEVLPLACHVELLWHAEQEEQAAEQFDQLRAVAATLDLDSPLAKRLSVVAKLLGHEGDWRLPFEPGADFGSRPSLDSLGPFRWLPSPAPAWTLPDATGGSRSLAEFKGGPVLVIYYLGYGCLHCAEQLQAFAPMKQQFKQAGIEIIAVSSDDVEGLEISLKNYKQGRLPIPLVADPQLSSFKDYRAFDDFEKQPLHGTFLIDADGRVRWQDISFEPFMDPKFLLGEAQRLLQLDASPTGLATK